MAVDQASIAAQLTAGIAAVNAAISTAGVLQNDAPEVLSIVYEAVQSARAPFETAIAAYDADIDTSSFGGVSDGMPVPEMAASLLTQAADVAQQSLLIIGEAFLSRAGINVLNSPS